MNFNYFFRKYSSSFRTYPDFIIAGAQKSGTSSLAHYLSMHPNVIFSKIKEIHHFNQNADGNINEYKYFFPTRFYKKLFSNVISGEATPDYMIYPQFAEIASKISPNLKIIILLKNPVDRAFSHYRHNLMMKREWLSFEDAIEIETKRVDLDYIDLLKTKKDAIKNYSNYSYKAKGIYFEQIEWLYRHFPKKNIKIMEFNSFVSNIENNYDMVCDFLGLKPFKNIIFEAHNVNKIKLDLNIKTRAKLVEFFEPHNDKLYNIIQENYNWK